MGHRVPTRGVIGDDRHLQGQAGHHDGLAHAGFLVHVLGLEVLARLHLHERAPGGVAHDADPIPDGRSAEQLGLDGGHEHQLGTDGGERLEGGVAVVRLHAGELAHPAVGVGGTLLVGHEVDHPHRAVVGRVHGGQASRVVVVDRCVRHRRDGKIEVIAHRTSWLGPTRRRQMPGSSIDRQTVNR